jgi:hypothetical protein
MNEDFNIDDLNKRYGERMCAHNGTDGIIEKVFKGRRCGLLRAKVLMNNGVVRYFYLYDLAVR